MKSKSIFNLVLLLGFEFKTANNKKTYLKITQSNPINYVHNYKHISRGITLLGFGIRKLLKVNYASNL